MPHRSVPQTLKAAEARSKRTSKAVREQSATNERGQLENIVRTAERLLSILKKNAAVVGALLLAGVLIWFFMPLGRSFALADLLGEQGYWETVPPAEYYLPGTFNTIEVRSDGKVAIYPTCKIDPELLARMTLHSHTMDHTFAERLNKGFDISDRFSEFLPAGMEGRKLKNVKLSLQNSNILQITDEELMFVKKAIVKDSCQEAIEINIKSGATVCQTRAALMGDLIYDVSYETSVSAHTNDTTGDVERGQANTDRIVGTGLIYGVSFVPHDILSGSSEAKSASCQGRSKNKPG